MTLSRSTLVAASLSALLVGALSTPALPQALPAPPAPPADTEPVAATTAPQHAGHDLGKVDFPVSCSPAAQVAFNRAVALLHHMTYPQAREAFEGVAATDPQCAMAHWGIAMTLFQPLWPTRPSPADLQRGWEAVEKAKALGPATDRERLFVAAAEAFFREPTSSDYWSRIRRWEGAMEAVYVAYPHDPEAEALYALALLATAPSDRVDLAHAERAAQLLEEVYEQNPDHPGAMHYMIHANDAPGREAESLEMVRKYETVAPRNPHAIHMPTHIYTRLGDWDAVIRGNLRAAEAALEVPAGDHGEWVWDEFPHAIEYLVYAELQKGADGEAAAQIQRLLGTAHLQPSFKTAFHLASTRARYALERRDWSAAAQLVPRDPPILDWDRFPWPEAVTWFARGLGAARLGKVEEAERADRRLEDLEAAAGKAGEDLFARNIRVLRLEVDAWLAQARGGPRRRRGADAPSGRPRGFDPQARRDPRADAPRLRAVGGPPPRAGPCGRGLRRLPTLFGALPTALQQLTGGCSRRPRTR